MLLEKLGAFYMNKVLKIMVGLVRIIFILTGCFCFFWSLFCFLGGPEGEIWSKEAIVFGFGSIIAGGIFIFAGKRIGWQ
ncbi:MAG: hypothetical protein A2270_06935 [Elusimicrobia bacterium RIFOXYA12_FULL_51_18]|nr:MAG: hypothetical protein A2270_06935 [Elusimicrobia bacterium RIFOXYA12_FULL_51_18]